MTTITRACMHRKKNAYFEPRWLCQLAAITIYSDVCVLNQ